MEAVMEVVVAAGAQTMQDKSDVCYKLGRLFAALAHPARARIVQELGSGEMCVNTLAEILNISHSSVSQHLAILRAQRIIKEQKSGRFVFYRLVDPTMAGWMEVAAGFVSENRGAGDKPDGGDKSSPTTSTQPPNVVPKLDTRSFDPSQI